MANQPDEHQVDHNPKNTEETLTLSSQACGGFFEIRVKGHLDSQWSDWFEGLQVVLLDNGETILSGIIIDQAALMGVLNKINRLNLPLISVNEVIKRNGG